MPVCTRCRTDKGAHDFAPDKRRPSGLQSRCRACQNEEARAKYAANLERERARSRENERARRARLSEEDLERERVRARARTRANAEQHRMRARAWYQANRDRGRAARSAWYAANAGRVRTWHRGYRQVNREKIDARVRAWRRSNPDRTRAHQRSRAARRRALPAENVVLSVVLERDGPTCWMCGTIPSRSALDHLIPLAADTDALARLGVPNPGTVVANLALACWPCNSRKQARVMLCAVARYLANCNEPEE